MIDIQDTLKERKARYGEFKDHARITQLMKTAAKSADGWDNLTDSQREALEMIFHKIGRILNGDPNYADSWHDISGYARLEENILNQNKECQNTDAPTT